VEVIGPNFSVLVNTGHNAVLFQLSRSVTIKTFSLAHRCRSFVPRGARAWQLFDGRHGAGGSLGAGFNSNAGGFGGGPGANGGPPGQGRRPTMGSIRPGFSAELQWVQRKQRAIPPSLRAMEDHGWQKRARGRGRDRGSGGGRFNPAARQSPGESSSSDRQIESATTKPGGCGAAQVLPQFRTTGEKRKDPQDQIMTEAGVEAADNARNRTKDKDKDMCCFRCRSKGHASAECSTVLFFANMLLQLVQ
jgi:hypothetical protein